MERELSARIKQILLDEFKMGVRNGLYATTQKLMAYNSNRIEGSTLTSEQTASLFDTGMIVSGGIEVYRAKDIEEATGHFKMFNQMLKHIDEPLSIELIKSYHYQLKSGVFEDAANGYPVGEFKSRANRVSDITTESPKNVEESVQRLLKDYECSDKTLRNIAEFHARYEKIHPFQDGNGRTGRIIIVKQCLDAGLVPSIIRDSDKGLYYNALHKAQVENEYDPLMDFLEKSKEQYLAEIGDLVYMDRDVILQYKNLQEQPNTEQTDSIKKLVLELSNLEKKFREPKNRFNNDLIRRQKNVKHNLKKEVNGYIIEQRNSGIEIDTVKEDVLSLLRGIKADTSGYLSKVDVIYTNKISSLEELRKMEKRQMPTLTL